MIHKGNYRLPHTSRTEASHYEFILRPYKIVWVTLKGLFADRNEVWYRKACCCKTSTQLPHCSESRVRIQSVHPRMNRALMLATYVVTRVTSEPPPPKRNEIQVLGDKQHFELEDAFLIALFPYRKQRRAVQRPTCYVLDAPPDFVIKSRTQCKFKTWTQRHRQSELIFNDPRLVNCLFFENVTRRQSTKGLCPFLIPLNNL